MSLGKMVAQICAGLAAVVAAASFTHLDNPALASILQGHVAYLAGIVGIGGFVIATKTNRKQTMMKWAAILIVVFWLIFLILHLWTTETYGDKLVQVGFAPFESFKTLQDNGGDAIKVWGGQVKIGKLATVGSYCLAVAATSELLLHVAHDSKLGRKFFGE